MGSALARAVSDNWGHLPAGPYKVLMRMAIRSLDTAQGPDKPAKTYWRGWQDQSVALGRKLPDDSDMSDEAIRKRKTVKDELRRYTNQLVKEGAVHRAVDEPGKGTRQVWKLTVGEPNRAYDP